MKERWLLDLYCMAGGAAMGYHRAGFKVVGVDNQPQKRYPFEFHQADALEFLERYGGKFDAIHASPPCQRYSTMSNCWGENERLRHAGLIEPTRELLVQTEQPYVIENVVGSPLINPVTLCGVWFGLKVYRHRLFESNIHLAQPPHEKHPEVVPRAGYGASPSGYISVAGHFSNVKAAREAMDIDWMVGRELAQAIPPAYTEYIGIGLMNFLDKEG